MLLAIRKLEKESGQRCPGLCKVIQKSSQVVSVLPSAKIGLKSLDGLIIRKAGEQTQHSEDRIMSEKGELRIDTDSSASDMEVDANKNQNAKKRPRKEPKSQEFVLDSGGSSDYTSQIPIPNPQSSRRNSLPGGPSAVGAEPSSSGAGASRKWIVKRSYRVESRS